MGPREVILPQTDNSFVKKNQANFEILLRHILLVKHFRIGNYKFVAAKGGNAPSYKLEVRASPGNIAAIEHILYVEGEVSIRDTKILVGIKLNPGMVAGQVSLGLAALDTRLNMVKVTDFLDNEQIFWITGSGECQYGIVLGGS